MNDAARKQDVLQKKIVFFFNRILKPLLELLDSQQPDERSDLLT